MDTKEIIQTIDTEIARLEQVKALLNGHTAPAKRGRPVKPRRGKMSAEGRARIAAAQRRDGRRQKEAEKKGRRYGHSLPRM